VLIMLDLCLRPAAREHAEAALATAREIGSSTWSLSPPPFWRAPGADREPVQQPLREPPV